MEKSKKRHGHQDLELKKRVVDVLKSKPRLGVKDIALIMGLPQNRIEQIYMGAKRELSKTSGPKI